MSWGEALRRPRIANERSPEHLAFAGDLAMLRLLAAAAPRWTPMEQLGGVAAAQAIYRLRNTYGSDVIETLTGLGYRLSKRGLGLISFSTGTQMCVEKRTRRSDIPPRVELSCEA